MQISDKKRLFFGLEVEAPWPHKLPEGRVLQESHRHLTLAFLGETDFSKLSKALNSIPLPSFTLGLVGKFDKCLFLPEKHPHVVAWHVEWMDKTDELISFQKSLTEWLFTQGFLLEIENKFLPHVTICRSPFIKKQWEKSFEELPLSVNKIHLYESLGGLKYQPIWTHSLISPFEEIDHTADIGFWIRGNSLEQLYIHAQVALSFHFPNIIPYFPKQERIDNIDSIITSLNIGITRADSEIGCPLKAVSYHGNIHEKTNVLEWEMIVDV